MAWQELHLHQKLALLQRLHAALAHDGGNVVLAVCQAVEGEGCVVLQIAVAGGHELQEGPQTTSLQQGPCQPPALLPACSSRTTGMHLSR